MEMKNKVAPTDKKLPFLPHKVLLNDLLHP